MADKELVTPLLALKTPPDRPGLFTACVRESQAVELTKGTVIDLDYAYSDCEKRVATITKSCYSDLDGIGAVVQFSAVMIPGPISERAYRLLKGRRVKQISLLTGSSGQVKRVSLIGPRIEAVAKPSPNLQRSINPQPVAIDKPKKIIEHVNRNARNGSFIVYLMFSHIDALLYVGITKNGMRRMVEHERTKPWFDQVARIEIERYEELIYAARREKRLIEKFAPLYNVTHNLGRQLSI